jgi:hypothetical protein
MDTVIKQNFLFGAIQFSLIVFATAIILVAFCAICATFLIIKDGEVEKPQGFIIIAAFLVIDSNFRLN